MVPDTEFPPRQRNLLPVGNEPKAGPTSGAEGPWGLPTSMAGGSSRAGSAASPEVGRGRRAEGRDTPTVRVSRETGGGFHDGHFWSCNEFIRGVGRQFMQRSDLMRFFHRRSVCKHSRSPARRP